MLVGIFEKERKRREGEEKGNREKQKQKKKKNSARSWSPSSGMYQSHHNKPDRVVDGNNVVKSNRVAGCWRGDGQSSVE